VIVEYRWGFMTYAPAQVATVAANDDHRRTERTGSPPDPPVDTELSFA